MKAVLRMTPEKKSSLLEFSFESLNSIANEPEGVKIAIQYCDNSLAEWRKMKDAILEFSEVIHGQSTESVITEMANVYKELSREERLEFCKAIAGESNLENSLDLLDYI